MRTLYLPEDGRRSRQTEETLARSVQDNIEIGPGSGTHAALNVLVTERERLLGQLSRLDVRPWRADTRMPGSVEEASDRSPEAESEEKLLYAVPDAWALSPETLREYTFSPSSVLRGGYEPTDAQAIDRAVETTRGLVVQAGSDVWEVKARGRQARRLQEGSFGAFRPYSGGWCLTSLAEDKLSLMPGAESERSKRVDFELKGLDIRVEEPGNYHADLTYTRAEPISSIAENVGGYWLLDRRTLEDVVEIGHAVKADNGEPMKVQKQGESLLRFDYDGTLYFRVERRLEHVSRPGETQPELSFSEYAPEMHSYPDRRDVKVWHTADVVAEVSRVGPGKTVVGRSGRVVDGGHFGHEVHAVLPSEHHVVGTSRSGHVSLYCPASEEVLLSQHFSGEQIRGVTWTREGRLGLVLATGPNTLEVRELLDVRDKRIGPWTPRRT